MSLLAAPGLAKGAAFCLLALHAAALGRPGMSGRRGRHRCEGRGSDLFGLGVYLTYKGLCAFWAGLDLRDQAAINFSDLFFPSPFEPCGMRLYLLTYCRAIHDF